VSEDALHPINTKKVIYGREKHRVKRNKIEEQESQQEEQRSDLYPSTCLTSILQPVWLDSPYQEYTNSSHHSYPSHWATQSPYYKNV